MPPKKILIVEDDPDLLLGMDLRLQAYSYETFSAVDAQACLVEARRHGPDLIILDLGLPDDDGFVLIDKFRSIPSLTGVPVIVVSGRDIRENQKRIVRSGAKAFLRKPIDNTLLLAVVREALGEGSAHR